MKWQRNIVTVVLLGCLSGAALAQDDNILPVAIDGTIVWTFCPDGDILNSFNGSFIAITSGASCPLPFLSWDPLAPARQGLYTLAAPGDAISIEFDAFDQDWLPEEPEDPNEVDPNEPIELNEEDVFVCIEMFTRFGGPNISLSFPRDCQVIGVPQDPNDPRVPVSILLSAPNILGPTINRLIADQNLTAPDYDDLVTILITLTNSEDPEEDEFVSLVPYADPRQDPNLFDPNSFDPNQLITATIPVLAARFDLRATSNGPAFADAGPDRLTIPGTTITLDASDTFDGTNVGFDVDAPLTFAEDTITYAWEWISGPTQIDPVQPSDTSTTATVTLPDALLNTDPNGEDVYTYRVTVSDNFNVRTTSDTVQVVVRRDVENLPPLLVLERVTPLTSDVQLNETVTLSAAASLDLNTPAFPEPLSFFWTQVDELGAPITTEDATELFLPLNGVDTSTISFQATKLGEFFFRVTITDGDLLATDTIGIVVTDSNVVLNGRAFRVSELLPSNLANANQVQTETEPTAATTTDEDTPQPVVSPAGLCGFGLMLPLLAVPVGLWSIRRRR